MLHWNFENIFHLDGSLASSLDVDGHYHCGKVPVDRILVSHQFACSIGTSCSYEYDQHVEGFDGPGADNRPSRYVLPIVHDRGLLSRNLDVDLKISVKLEVKGPVCGSEVNLLVIPAMRNRSSSFASLRFLPDAFFLSHLSLWLSIFLVSFSNRLRKFSFRAGTDLK